MCGGGAGEDGTAHLHVSAGADSPLRTSSWPQAGHAARLPKPLQPPGSPARPAHHRAGLKKQQKLNNINNILVEV